MMNPRQWESVQGWARSVEHYLRGDLTLEIQRNDTYSPGSVLVTYTGTLGGQGQIVVEPSGDKFSTTTGQRVA